MTAEEQQLLGTEVVRIARGVLSRTIGVTEGSRLLCRLGSQLNAGWDSDFVVFKGIDSETDQFPLGRTRRHWNPETLARFDAEREGSEEHYRDYAESACRNLISRFETPPQ